MKPGYMDIRARLGDPLWWDGHGVPRYDPFSPELLDVYWRHAAYLEIACQECGLRFLVATCTRGWDTNDGLPTADSPQSFAYKDPPIHGCVGDTMTSRALRIIEFWQRVPFCDPVRLPYEFNYEHVEAY